MKYHDGWMDGLGGRHISWRHGKEGTFHSMMGGKNGMGWDGLMDSWKGMGMDGWMGGYIFFFLK